MAWLPSAFVAWSVSSFTPTSRSSRDLPRVEPKPGDSAHGLRDSGPVWRPGRHPRERTPAAPAQPAQPEVSHPGRRAQPIRHGPYRLFHTATRRNTPAGAEASAQRTRKDNPMANRRAVEARTCLTRAAGSSRALGTRMVAGAGSAAMPSRSPRDRRRPERGRVRPWPMRPRPLATKGGQSAQ